MHKDMRQTVKRLQRDGTVIGVEPSAKHWRLTLRDGSIYTCSGTPSDWRGLRNMVAEIQRILRLTDR